MGIDEIIETNYRDKPDMTMIWLRHMDRTNLSSGYLGGPFDAYVRQQLRLLPLDMQRWVEDQADLYTYTETEYAFIKRSGIRVGSKSKPALYDNSIPVLRSPDGSIDWDDSNIKSPKRKTNEITDYEALNSLILVAAEKAGLSWNIEKNTIAVEVIDEPKRYKTPYKTGENDE